VTEGQSFQPAYVIVSNNPHLFAGDSTDYVSSLFADGFKIPDFKLDQPFYSTREMRLTREKHRAMYDLLSSIRTHAQIPTTFDGRILIWHTGRGRRGWRSGKCTRFPMRGGR